MNYREYKQYVEQFVICDFMSFKVRKHWTSKISVDLFESSGGYFGTLVDFDKKSNMDEAHFGDFNKLFGSWYINAEDAQTLFKILTATSSFLNTPYEMRFKKEANVSGNPVNNSETTKLFVSNDDSQKYFLKDKVIEHGYLKAFGGDIKAAFAEYLDSDGKVGPFVTTTIKEKAGVFTVKDLQAIYTFLIEHKIEAIKDYEIVKASPEEYVVLVGMPENASDFIGQYTLDEIEKMQKDPQVAIDWDKAVIETVKDFEAKHCNRRITKEEK